ncbi:uncharacterized protein LOC119684486 [Teleopsis dalmanni]|uniref:uncharacterized protein LOC119684486 n=1 Tax=Teleopsis dalmanni TaxID=139649 RepID=UPI0018CC8A10|nr:uncharacterized protein LOC119684486 [Teleopsis dalmanni]
MAQKLKLYEAQKKLGEEIITAVEKIKEKGLRKTADKIEKVEKNWKKFQVNHEELLKEGAETDEYFKECWFDTIQKYYKKMLETDNTTETTEKVNKEENEADKISEDNDITIVDTKKEVQKISKLETRLMRLIEDLQEDLDAMLEIHYNNELQINTQLNIVLYQLNESKKKAELVVKNELEPVKLEPFKMPTFNGDVKEWNTFSNLFHEAIHIRDIPDSEKMYRLKAVVKGEAGRLIQHMNVSEANYKTAWEMLQKRYNNRRWLFRTQVDQLLDQPSTTVGDAESIRQLTDTTNECINTIKGMGIDLNNAEPLIARIILRKLDKESLRMYELGAKNPTEIQSLDEVQKFLEHQFQALDAMKNKETDDRKRNYPKKICAYCNKAGHTTNECRKFSAISNIERRLPVNQQINTSINFSCAFCRKQGHKIYSCSSFSSLPISNKRAFLNANDTCKICLSHKNQDKCISKYTCKICNSRDHHTLLHNEHQQEKKDKSTKTKVIAVTKKDESEVVLLPTAIVKGKTIRGEYKELHALIDQGSQASMISEEAVHILGLQKVKTDIKLTGLAETSVGQANSKVIMEIKSKINNINMKEEFKVMNNLIRPLPEKTIDYNKNQWKSYNLADPEFMKTKQIDLIIGSDIIPKIIKKGFKKINGIIAQETIFGWIISGKVLKKPAKRSKVTITTKNIEKFWELEEADNTINEKTAEDEICMQFYADTTKIDGDKKFIVKLPLKTDATLGESRNQAMARFLNQEKKMSNEKRTEYIKFMQEYEQKGHMEKVKDNTIGKYYLPHQAVIRESSRTTKLRVVFDTSAKSTNGKSLNDIMMTGPRLQQDIFDILMKWRLWKFVASADVEKMFRLANNVIQISLTRQFIELELFEDIF